MKTDSEYRRNKFVHNILHQHCQLHRVTTVWIISAICAATSVVAVLYLMPDNKQFELSVAPTESLGSSTTEQVINESPKSIPRSNWKQFRAKQVGFTIEYPYNWEPVVAKERRSMELVMRHEILLEDEIYKVTFFEQNPGVWQGDFELIVWDNPNELTIDIWRQEKRQQKFEENRDCIEPVPFGCFTEENLVENGTPTRISGLPAFSDQHFAFDHVYECTQTAQGQYVFELCYEVSNPNDPQFQKHRQITSRMLDSFMFLP